MKWSIEYYSPKVEEEVLNLPDELLSPYFRLADLMLEFGPNLEMTHTRPIENGLFELRIKSKEGIARVIFCTKRGNKIIVLHIFVKKTQKTPQKELKLANKRMLEVLKNDA